MKKRYFLLLVVAVIAQVLWAKNEWTIKNKVYEVDTIIYPPPWGRESHLPNMTCLPCPSK